MRGRDAALSARLLRPTGRRTGLGRAFATELMHALSARFLASACVSRRTRRLRASLERKRDAQRDNGYDEQNLEDFAGPRAYVYLLHVTASFSCEI